MTLTDKIARVKEFAARQPMSVDYAWGCDLGDACDTWRQEADITGMIDIIKQLEAKLEIAWEGLQFYADDKNWYLPEGYYCSDLMKDDSGTKAKQALSKINEGL